MGFSCIFSLKPIHWDVPVRTAVVIARGIPVKPRFSAAAKPVHGERKAPMRMTTEEAFVKTLQMSLAVARNACETKTAAILRYLWCGYSTWQWKKYLLVFFCRLFCYQNMDFQSTMFQYWRTGQIFASVRTFSMGLKLFPRPLVTWASRG